MITFKDYIQKVRSIREEAESGESSMILHKGNMVHTTNSNGHKIHSNEAGIKKFHDWFSGSTAVDHQNKPHVFYHGTTSDFKEFKSGTANQWGSGHYFIKSAKIASDYATDSTTGSHARGMAPSGNASPNVIPVYLKMKKPFVMDDPLTGETLRKIEKHSGHKLRDHIWRGMKNRDIHQILHQGILSGGVDAANEVLKKSGFDSMREKHGDSIHMVFHPQNIKSVHGNSGKYSSKSMDITEELSCLDKLKTMLVSHT